MFIKDKRVNILRKWLLKELEKLQIKEIEFEE